MVQVSAVYEGDLHCRISHGPSGQAIGTDAPTDNGGRGEAFSPTDLVAAALGSCILTTMGLVAARHQIDLRQTSAVVRKEMTAAPRRIAKLPVTVTFRREFSEQERRLLEGAALSCPVHRSLGSDVDAPVEFVYPSATG